MIKLINYILFLRNKMTTKKDKNLDLISSLQQKKVVNEEKAVNKHN